MRLGYQDVYMIIPPAGAYWALMTAAEVVKSRFCVWTVLHNYICTTDSDSGGGGGGELIFQRRSQYNQITKFYKHVYILNEVKHYVP